MRIIDNIRPDRQTVMFSATFPRPMEALARRILKKPIEVQVGGRSVVCKDVEQHVAVLEEEAKFFKLLELLGHHQVSFTLKSDSDKSLISHLNFQESGSIIVFVDKQENADILLKDLMKASYPCMSLHGGIGKKRTNNLTSFPQSGIKTLFSSRSIRSRLNDSGL